MEGSQLERFEILASSDPGIFCRQQTLQATIDWSYNLLSVSEKTLFERISVFSGGFELEAAEEVGDELAKQYEKEGIAMGFEKAVEYALDFEKD